MLRTARRYDRAQNCRWSGGLDAAELAQSAGAAEGAFAGYSMAELVRHINREAIRHGAEIALLRDLYRARR